MEPRVQKKVSGWGRFPVVEAVVYRPEKRREVPAIVGGQREGTYLARGCGRSYGDASVNDGGGLIDMSRLNRMTSFDEETGLLECEAGVTLAEILETFVPRGFFPPVLPGTKFVTVGGAIANDIHGKNHHKDGTFSMFVESFELLTAGGDVITCSKEDNSDIFWATAGGIGMTGIILSARLRLRRIETAYVEVDYVRARNLEAALAVIAESDENYTYSVGWVDCLAKGASLGRAILMRANHAPVEALGANRGHPLRVPAKRQKNVPIDFPAFVLNPLSINLFNHFYYAIHREAKGRLVDFDSYFCPLDAILNWNRMYGRRGFGQYQVTIPLERPDGLVALLERISRSSCASFLAVLKKMGGSNPGILSYPSEGYTFTMDIPMRADLAPLLHALDEHVLGCGGRLYCAKDSTTRPETFAAMYPRLDELRAIKARLDPTNRFSSTMARRLRIV